MKTTPFVQVTSNFLTCPGWDLNLDSAGGQEENMTTSKTTRLSGQAPPSFVEDHEFIKET